MFLTAYSNNCMWISHHSPFFLGGGRALLSFIPGWPGPCYVTQVSLRFVTILLPQPSVCWDSSYVSPCLGSHQFLTSSLCIARFSLMTSYCCCKQVCVFQLCRLEAMQSFFNVFFFFLAVLGIELKALRMLSMCTDLILSRLHCINLLLYSYIVQYTETL